VTTEKIIEKLRQRAAYLRKCFADNPSSMACLADELDRQAGEIEDCTKVDRETCKHCGLRVYWDESTRLPTQPHWRHHGSNLRECYITFAEPFGAGPVEQT
jgi:hypothetical protein